MRGDYTTVSREFELPTYRVKWGRMGMPPDYDGTTRYPIVKPSQTTYSYRTSRRSTSERNEISEDDLRVTRNGFTTYDPQWDKGHEFWTTKTTATGITPDAYATVYGNGAQWWWRGPLIPQLQYNPGRFPSVERAGEAYTTAMGQRAIAKCAPTSPSASVATMIGEMTRDGLPSMLGMSALRSRGNLARSAGSEYLNVQFGWLPLIADLRKLVKSLQGSHTRLAQLQRDNGRVVRRRMAFAPDVTSSERTYDGLFGTPYSTLGIDGFIKSGQAQVLQISRTERSAWFSGAFSYSLPSDDNLMNKLERYSAMANVILGNRMTPETLWELAPWSWLVDWQFGIGHALSAATRMSEDSLVIRYGYLMVKTIRDDSYHVGPVQTLSGQTLPPCSLNLRSEIKERVRATPYGFGLNTEGFSLDRVKILGALGLSRTPGVGFKPYIP